jgi:hypothetical protein
MPLVAPTIATGLPRSVIGSMTIKACGRIT